MDIFLINERGQKMGKFKEMLIENGCIYGSKLCDNCQKCFECEDLEYGLEYGLGYSLDENDYRSIYHKIQESSLPENEKKAYYENIIDTMENKYEEYVVISTFWKELKLHLSI